MATPDELLWRDNSYGTGYPCGVSCAARVKIGVIKRSLFGFLFGHFFDSFCSFFWRFFAHFLNSFLDHFLDHFLNYFLRVNF